MYGTTAVRLSVVAVGSLVATGAAAAAGASEAIVSVGVALGVALATDGSITSADAAEVDAFADGAAVEQDESTVTAATTSVATPTARTIRTDLRSPTP
jgi:hypothetical protein